MLQNHIEKTLEAIAEEVNGTVYKGYSGRGMFGAQCFGITCPNYLRCIEEAATAGIRGARYDSMGNDFIVYWPHLKYEEKDE